MSWLSKATGIHINSHSIGNLVKNLSPLLAFTPLGAVGAGAAGALGERLRGKTGFGNLLKTGLGNAALGAGLHSASGLLNRGAASAAAPQSASGISINSGATAAGPAIDPANILASEVANPANAAAGAAGGAAGGATSSGGLLARVGHGAGKVLKFADAHPTAAGMALQGVGNLATAGAENRMHNAEADVLEQRAGETRYDFDARKRRDAQLAPVWSALGTQVGGGYGGVAPNPYSVGG